ncbi:MAG: SCO family protein [Bacteroidales bacterium]|jgi:cytochrome oxidase Cu insertion factor (SCO1/SenC/PrrC family)|nr:SCO family protein [Bacteroidales bacterium]
MSKNIVFLLLLIIGFCNFVEAQTTSNALKEETNIYEKVFDVPLQVVDRQSASFDKLYAQRPVILALIFTRCTGICNPFLVKLKENLQFKTQENPFQVLVVSFDPRDSVSDMRRLAQNLGLEDNKQWTFATTDSISRLNQSVGFDPVWDSLRQQFDHDALLVGINKEGYITKKLIGLREQGDLELLIGSVNNIFSPTYRLPNQNSLFSCFNYDPVTGKNTPGLGLLFLALPAILTTILLVSISYSVRRSRQKREQLN